MNTCTATTQTGCTATLVGQSLKASTRNLSDAQINSVLAFLISETGPTPRSGNQRIFMPKVDVNLNSNNTLTATYNYFRWKSPSGIQTQPTNTFGVTSFGDDFVNADSLNFRLASNLSPTLINEARYQWSRDFEFEFSKTPLTGEPLTAPGYPDKPELGGPIIVPRDLEAGTLVFHAGTRRDPDGTLRVHGGRVLTVTGLGDTVAEAARRSSDACELISFQGKTYRRDIGWREIREARAGAARG